MSEFSTQRNLDRMDTIISNLLQTPTASAWQHIGIRHHHGICVPLFSLRSRKSAGIGEYLDLLPLLDWCKAIGFDILQLLPLNDTGTETSPYSALSAFALNPIHLSLHALPGWQEIAALQEIYRELQELNQTQRVDYPRVFSLKNAFLRIYFKTQQNMEWKEFQSQTAWLEDDCLFKALKNQKQLKSWLEWPEEWKNPTEAQLQSLKNLYREEIDYHSFLQFQCFRQLHQVHEYANQRKIWLKGDIPILFSKDCADVWRHRPLFDLRYSAGAPPDMYNADGQDWGFPIYNWGALEKTNYSWWRNRLQTASQFYDLYRLDHIVGFYRIWAKDLVGGTKGFVPENSNDWIAHGDKVLRALIAANPMLPIGEDLGVIPPEVRRHLRSAGICGTKVMRWERRWNTDRGYIPPGEYEPISMTTVSTHDSEPLKLWWRNNPEEAKEFAHFKHWPYDPLLSREQLREILYDSHHSASLLHINLLQEYLSLIPEGTWGDPEEERINTPGVISPKNWSYRFRLTVEEICSHTYLSEEIRKILS